MAIKLIGISGAMGSGKSYSASYLVNEYGYELVKFAGPLKDMLRAIGLTDEHIEGDLKEEPCDLLCGKTPRYAMQTLGTEWGRNILGDDLWGELWRSRVERIIASGGKVVTDDVRFSNEAQRIKSMGGLLIGLVNPNDQAAVAHSSEVFDFEPHIKILNDKTLEDNAIKRTFDFLMSTPPQAASGF